MHFSNTFVAVENERTRRQPKQGIRYFYLHVIFNREAKALNSLARLSTLPHSSQRVLVNPDPISTLDDLLSRPQC